MNDLIAEQHAWTPFAALGLSHPFFTINADTVWYTWVSLAAIGVLIMVGRYCMDKPQTIGGYLLRRLLVSFRNLIKEATGTFIFRYYTFVGSLFIFILVCNWIALIPHVEEPTKDLNTTLALGITTFIFSQKEMIKAHGFIGFLQDYFRPIHVWLPLDLAVGLVMLPLKLLGELASVVSVSFRLFGNIFGGAIINAIYKGAIANSILYNILGLGLGLVILLFFVLFEGFLQAFIFSLLSLTHISMSVKESALGVV